LRDRVAPACRFLFLLAALLSTLRHPPIFIVVDALAVTPAPVRCVFGMRGFGKTTLARELVAAEPRVLAYDPLDEHGCLALEWEAFKAYVEANLPRPRFRLALVDDAEWSEDFCAIARVLAERQPGYTLLLEEADLVAEPGHEPPVFSG